jgi:tetraacyldisaccharide 4'-kinase
MIRCLVGDRKTRVASLFAANMGLFRELVSGRRTGAGASLARSALRLAEPCYAAVVGLRNRRFDRGATAIHRVDVPVVSVGNLTLGGTGKTPLVRWIAQWFQNRGTHAAVISRGYGAKPNGDNDEALELRRLLPDVPHLQNADRVAASREAIALGCQAIVLDDGFQHRRIARDLDIVLLDALEPFGFGHVFPRGMLREPIEGLRRADVVVLSRADLLDTDRREEIWQTVRTHAPEAAMAEASHAPRTLISADGRTMPLDEIWERPVAAFCGVGNPAGFRHTLEQCGCQIADFWEFADHHRYTPRDVRQLAEWAAGLDVSAVVCTCKDLVKLDADRLGDVPLWAVRIDMEFLEGQAALESRLRKLGPAGTS